MRRVVLVQEIQLVNYLVAAGKPVGLVLSFGERRVEVKRKVKKPFAGINPAFRGVIRSKKEYVPELVNQSTKMARAFSHRERNVIIAGGVFVVCFLTYWFVLLPQREELANLRAKVRAMGDEYKDIQKIQAQYNRLKRESDPVMQRILQRRKDFDLSAFAAESENQQNFKRTREYPPSRDSYGNFDKTTGRFRYEDKTLDQIVEFLKVIEKPENVIAIESLTITPKSTSNPSRLTLEFKLATVVPARGGK